MLLANFINATNYYVDGSVSTSGNGLSWATAWKTITEATQTNLLPGDVVYIKNGTYVEGMYLEKSGAEIIPITTGISISGNKIYFPASTDLSAINLTSNPNEYYIYVYRSWKSNNGYFKITQVNNSEHYIEIENPNFTNESGAAGDAYGLSASIGHPIIFKNGANNPTTERVILDVSSTNINTIATLGIFQGTNWDDALPVDYNIIDGIDFTGSKQGGGWHIQSSNFNVVANCKIYNTGTVALDNCGGILINGNQTHPAKYNIIYNNEIYNTPLEGVYIGAGSHPQFNNYTFFNHVIANTIYTLGTAPNAHIENAIDIKEWNYGNVVERNIIGDFQLSTINNGAIDVVHDAHHTLVYNNILKNITKGTENDIYFTISVNENADYTYVFNNLIYNQTDETGDHYAFYLSAENNTNSYVAHNTIYNYAGGILTASGGTDFIVANNIIDADNPIDAWTEDFEFSNNLYSTTPSYFASEPNRQVGNPNFEDPANADFRLTAQSTLAVNNAIALTPVIDLDFNCFTRTSPNDIGAYEFGSNLTSISKYKFLDIVIYPNPVSNYLTISCYECVNKYFDAKIIDIYGKTVLQITNINEFQQIDLSKLTNSVYFLQLTDNKTVIETMKIIKQ